MRAFCNHSTGINSSELALDQVFKPGVQREKRRLTWKEKNGVSGDLLKETTQITATAHQKSPLYNLPCTTCRHSIWFPKPRSGQDFFLSFFLFFVLLGPQPRHMEVPRLGVESELQLLAYTTATAMQDPICVFDLHHSSRQCQILNPLSEARDQIPILMDSSWVC